jgi:hypothetical protein
MLRSGHDRRLEYGQLVERFKGIVFFGTPHNGASIATFVSRLGSVLRSSPAISELKRNASLLRDLSSWFTNNAQFHAWKIRVFFETMNTFGVRVVDDDGNPHIPNVTPIAIDADHFAIGPRGFASQRKTRMQGWLGRRANCGFLTRTAVRATRAPNRDAPAAVRCQRRS